MTAGKLFVSPLTISGLAQNGYPNFQAFIGCFVSPSEKHRTHSLKGPEPQYQDTLQCNVDEGDHTLSLDVINEDQERPGLIGSGQVPLGKVFETGRFEDCVPIVAPTGATLGYIFTRLNFTPKGPKEEQTSPYGLPPPPSYPHQAGGESAEERKVEVPHDGSQSSILNYCSQQAPSPAAYPYHSHMNGPQSPMPNYGAQQQGSSPGAYPYNNPFNGSFEHSNNGAPPAAAAQYYNSSSSSINMQYGSNGVPPPLYTPPGQSANAESSTVYGQQSPVPSSTTPTSAQSPTTAENPKKKEVPNWMKYGGAALAGAAAVGIGALVVNAFDSDEEQDEEANRIKQHEAEQRRLAEEYYYAQTRHQHQTRGMVDSQGPPSFEQEEERQEEEAREAEEEQDEEEQDEEEQDEEEQDEEEQGGEEQEEEREEELEEQEEEEEVPERPVINDSKWR